MEETDDPGASTAMFRAFVEHTPPPEAGETTSTRGPWIAAAIAVALIVLLVVALAL